MSILRDAVLWVAALALGLVGWTASAQADRTVNANHPVVISDDITNQSTTVISASTGGDDGDSDSGSGDSDSGSDDSDSSSDDSDTD